MLGRLRVSVSYGVHLATAFYQLCGSYIKPKFTASWMQRFLIFVPFTCDRVPERSQITSVMKTEVVMINACKSSTLYIRCHM